MRPARSPAGDDKIDVAGRARNAPVSKAALFRAAQELFSQKGYDRTTTREIGLRAGVDAALIARYFGSKADLYIAAVAAEQIEGPDAEAAPHSEETFGGVAQMVDALVTRIDRNGPGPIMQALVRSDTSPEILVAARARLKGRLVEPLMECMECDPSGRAQLRAEITVAALLGVSLARGLGWFEEVRSASKDELVALVVDVLGNAAPGPALDWSVQ